MSAFMRDLRARAPFEGSWRKRALGLMVVTALAAPGCATKGDHLKLEEKVMDYHREQMNSPDPFRRIAELSASVDALRDEVRRLEGELEVTQKTADDALAEAQRARVATTTKGGARSSAEAGAAGSATNSAGSTNAGTSGGGATTSAAAISPNSAGSPDGSSTAAVVPGAAPDDGSAAPGRGANEIQAYQQGLAAWRANDPEACVDRFRKFLQTYPASPYADDAAYWMADCHFKKGDYRVAVLRFNDVVRVYPTGNKAADALYRQGESLLKLGPGFHDAAETVFKQVVKDYPDSARAKEASEQLERIGKG